MSVFIMTAEEFEAKVGRPPENDDLERVNCDTAGTMGHSKCGLCVHGLPKFEVCEACWGDRWQDYHIANL